MSNEGTKCNIEVNTELMKYVLGKNKENLASLRVSFPNIRIAANYNTVFISSATDDIKPCIDAVNTLIDSAVVIKEDMDYKRRVNKEKETRRRAIQAANKLRENIEAELQRQQQSSAEIYNGSEADSEAVILATHTKTNKFAGLDIED